MPVYITGDRFGHLQRSINAIPDSIANATISVTEGRGKFNHFEKWFRGTHEECLAYACKNIRVYNKEKRTFRVFHTHLTSNNAHYHTYEPPKIQTKSFIDRLRETVVSDTIEHPYRPWERPVVQGPWQPDNMTVDFLSDKAFDHALYSSHESHHWVFLDEVMDDIKETWEWICDTYADYDVGDYSTDGWNNLHLDIPTVSDMFHESAEGDAWDDQIDWDDPDDRRNIMSMRGHRLWKFIYNNTPEEYLFGHIRGADFVAFKPFRYFLVNPDNRTTILDLMTEAASELAKLWSAEYEWETSEEYFYEGCMSNDYRFDEDGTLVG